MDICGKELWWLNPYKSILELISVYLQLVGQETDNFADPIWYSFFFLNLFIVFVVCHAQYLSCRSVSFSLQHLSYYLVFLSSSFWQVLFGRWPITRCCQIPGSWWWCWLGAAPGIIIFHNQYLHAPNKFCMLPITIYV